jgi:YVTN family beta-propeller protein
LKALKTFKRIVVVVPVVFTITCTKDVGRKQIPATEHLYPEAVANIINKCSTSGCHNSKSKDAAAGLNLETWNDLFKGGRGGAVVIPYRPDYSTLMFYVNSYSQFGTIQLSPRMPVDGEALNADEVKVLYDWIRAGAPNSKNEIKFADNPQRKKFYAANQGCDVVAVFDAASMLAMRYVDVGETRGTEAPHMLRVSPDNQFWCTCFITGGLFMKYSCATNSLVGKSNLGFGAWNTFAITSDSKRAYAVDWSSPGKIAEIDLTAMTRTIYPGYNYPHGSALSDDDKTLYVTSQQGNYLYKFDVTDMSNPKQVVLEKEAVASDFPAMDAHDIIFSPDRSRYFVTCQGSNDVRVIQTSNDSLIAIIPTGLLPQEMTISASVPYLFVSCMEDTTSGALQLSSICVINYKSNTIVKTIYAGYQSHGLAIDEENKRVYVSNRNIFSTGPAPHHQGICAGRNGYITAIDLNTLKMIEGFKAEVSIDPYSLGITH